MKDSFNKKQLIRRYRDNKATPEELEVFFRLLKDGAVNDELEEVMNEETGKQVPKSVHTWRIAGIAAAAILILSVSVSLFYFLPEKKFTQESPKPLVVKSGQDLLPGANKAVLYLSDGSSMVLDSASDGTLTQQGDATVLKNKGTLSYQQITDENKQASFNTVNTPRGGQFHLVLADGSKVWLNAASSIRFPTTFSGKERRVELTGEAYFEVAKNTAQPFIVVSGKAEIQVLGTHFNVNAYSDETSLSTTLLEGSVMVKSGSNNSVIKPGELAKLTTEGNISVHTVDVDNVVAWKNGMFSFKAASIEEIMRQLSRWYDFTVQYDKRVTEKFYVNISRNTNLSDILKILETTEAVHFKIEGKKVKVLP